MPNQLFPKDGVETSSSGLKNQSATIHSRRGLLYRAGRATIGPMGIADTPSWQSVFHAAALGIALGIWWVMPTFGPAWGWREIAEFVAIVFVVIRATRYFVTGRLLIE